MKEIKVAKYSKQWCKTRMTTSAIASIISFCVTVLTTPIMVHFYDEYGLHHVKTIVSIIVISTFLQHGYIAMQRLCSLSIMRTLYTIE
jgi:hypothetical protein